MFRQVLWTAVLVAAVCARAGAQQRQGSELAADRPGVTDGTGVVGRGIVQFETGTTLESTGGHRTMTAPLGLLRIGLNDRVELRLSGDGFVAASGSRGLADTEFGVKIRLLHSDAWGFDAAVLPKVTIPTGTSALTSGASDPAIKLAWAKSLPRGFDASGILNVSRVTDGGAVSTERTYSLSVSHGLAKHWGGYWELYGASRLERDGGAALTFDTGVTRALGENAQVDLEVGRGLSAAASDWFVGAGFAVRTRR